MHELGIVFHIIVTVEQVGRENGVTQVRCVTLDVGQVSGIEDPYLMDCWRWAADRSEMLRGARLQIETVHAVTLCDACGKTYDSREGFCPKCGAYNRPPRREWVDAGGDVHYAEQEKVCYEQKECHEEKVCYENQTRRPRPHIQWHVPKKNTASGAIGAVIAVSIVIVLINTLRGVSGDIFDRNEPMPDYGCEQVAPAEEIEATVREYAEIGASFYLEDSAFAVASLKADWERDVLTVYVVEGDTYQTFPYLVQVDSDGFENWYYPEDVVVSDTDDDVFICTYDLSVLEDLTGDTSLIFSGFDKEVAVPVDLAQW